MVVVIKIGALFVVLVLPTLSYETPCAVGTVYISPDPLLSGGRRLLSMARAFCRIFLQDRVKMDMVDL